MVFSLGRLMRGCQLGGILGADGWTLRPLQCPVLVVAPAIVDIQAHWRSAGALESVAFDQALGGQVVGLDMGLEKIQAQIVKSEIDHARKAIGHVAQTGELRVQVVAKSGRVAGFSYYTVEIDHADDGLRADKVDCKAFVIAAPETGKVAIEAGRRQRERNPGVILLNVAPRQGEKIIDIIRLETTQGDVVGRCESIWEHGGSGCGSDRRYQIGYAVMIVPGCGEGAEIIASGHRVGTLSPGILDVRQAGIHTAEHYQVATAGVHGRARQLSGFVPDRHSSR